MLILIQGLEMMRFLWTRPYHATWRNVYRFVLECFFILFLVLILTESYLIG